MNTIKRLSIIVLFIALLLVFSNLDVFADSFGKEEEELGHSDEFIMIDGEGYYLWRDTEYGYRVWLWMLEQDLGEFVQIEDNVMRKGKNHICRPIYFPVDNEGNPYNYALLKTEEAAKEMFKIAANSAAPTNLDLKYDKPISQGGMGKAYTTTYPSVYVNASQVGKKNYHFKIEFYDAIYKRFRDYGMKFFIYQGQEGNFSSGVSRNDATMHIPWSPAGFFSNELRNEDWSFGGRIFIDTETLLSYIPMGEYTKEYKMGLVSEIKMIQDFASYVAVYPELIDEMQDRTKNYGDFYTDYSSAVDNSREFFELSNQYNPPAKGLSGQATLAFTWKSKGIWRSSWASLITPVSSFENNITAYSMIMLDSETGLELDFEKVEDASKGMIKSYGIPRGKEMVTIKWAQGFEDGAQESIDVESLNANIVSNLYAESLTGDFTELAVKQEGTIKGKMKGFFSIDLDRYFELFSQTGISDFNALNELYPNEIMVLDESRLNWYQVDVPVEKLSESGYISSNTPWQFKHYTDFYFDEKMIVQVFADNVNESPADDMISIHYHTAEPKQKDIKIKSVEGFGTWNEQEKKYFVAPGQTYKVKVSIENNGALDTERINPAITWGTSEYTMTAEVRNNNAHKTNPTNPKVLPFESKETLDYILSVTVPSNVEHNQEFNVGVAIHVGEDDFDNFFVLNDDFRSVEAVVQVDEKPADIGISDIYLTSGSLKYTTKVEDPNVYKLDSAKSSYTVNIVVEKFNDDGTVENPKILFDYKTMNSDFEFYNVNLNATGRLTKKGDKLIIKYPLTTTYNYFHLRAQIDDDYHLSTTPKTNIDNQNDSKEVKYVGGQDFMVSNVTVSPDKIYLSPTESGKQASVNVTAIINTTSYGAGSFDDVKVRLKRISPSGSTSFISLPDIASKIDLISGETRWSYSIPSMYYSEGNTAYTVELNYDGQYYENDFSNNSGTDVVEVFKTPENVVRPYCWANPEHTRNDWSVKHTIIERKKNDTTCCSKYSGCRPCCRTVSTKSYNANPYPKDYYETINLRAYTRSKKSDWQWTSSDGYINAGRAFEIKWELSYYSNRRAYPRTENRLDNGSCGYDRTYSSVSSFSFNVPLFVEVSGYSFSNFNRQEVLYGTPSGSWNNYKLVYEIDMQTDSLGDVSRKLYTNINDADKTITFRAFHEPIKGYALSHYEDNGQNKYLIDCETIRVRITDAIDINKKTIE